METKDLNPRKNLKLVFKVLILLFMFGILFELGHIEGDLSQISNKLDQISLNTTPLSGGYTAQQLKANGAKLVVPNTTN